MTTMRWVGAVMVVGCGSAAPSTSTPPASAPCLADEIKTLRWQLPDYACEESDTCVQLCDANVANGCFLAAQAAEQRHDRVAARANFARACRLGMSLGCTNWAAGVWMPSKTPNSELCAKRVFEAACGARDPWACGMHGRFLADAANTDAERTAARAYFDRVCNDIGNVTCRMYGLHLENDQLGAWTPSTVKALMIRACETGDKLACDHETASETFD